MKRDTKNAIRTILLLFATAAIAIFALSVAFSAVAAPAGQTCDKAGYPEANKAEGNPSEMSGDWGTVTADGTEVVFDVEAGWTVEVCVKAGPDLVEVAATSLTESLHLDHDVSHMSWRNPTEPTPTPTGTETPSPTQPSETPTEPPSPTPSSPPSPEPTPTPDMPTPSNSPTPSSTPSTPASPTPSASPTATASSPTSPSETPTTSPSDAPPSTDSETPSTVTATGPTSSAPPVASSTPRSELAATGVSAWLLGAGAVVLSVLGAAFASFAGRMEGRR